MDDIVEHETKRNLSKFSMIIEKSYIREEQSKIENDEF